MKKTVAEKFHALDYVCSIMSRTNDPIERFRRVFQKAAAQEHFDHTACTLATADAEGRPSARIVLLKHFDQHGFVFYTNRTSRKGEELKANPRATLCFHWPAIDEQIRVEGPVELLPDEESDAYYASRPRGSQIGAWISNQSRPLSGRTELVHKYMQFKVKNIGRKIQRPPFWGGYRIVPDAIEFWRRHSFRLHDRFLYTLENGKWNVKMLWP